MIETITHIYDLQLEFLQAKQKQEELQNAVKQSAWALRQAKQKEVEYTSSLRFLLFDRLTRRTDRLEACQRAIRQAKANHESSARELEIHQLKYRNLEAEIQKLPLRSELEKSLQGNPEAEAEFARQEVRLCTELLRPLLAKNLEALEAYRQHLRGNNMDQITSPQELHARNAEHIRWAEQSAEVLKRLQPSMAHLGTPIELPDYFLSPAAYIDSAAARHNRLDRVSKAIAQAEAIQKRIQ